MSAESNDVLYKAAAVHIFKYEDGAIIKRGTLETYVRGESAFEVLQTIFDQGLRARQSTSSLGAFLWKTAQRSIRSYTA